MKKSPVILFVVPKIYVFLIVFFSYFLSGGISDWFWTEHSFSSTYDHPLDSRSYSRDKHIWSRNDRHSFCWSRGSTCRNHFISAEVQSGVAGCFGSSCYFFYYNILTLCVGNVFVCGWEAIILCTLVQDTIQILLLIFMG